MKIKFTFLFLFLICRMALAQTEFDRTELLLTNIVGKISLPEGHVIPDEGIHVHLNYENKDFFTDKTGNYILENVRRNSLYSIQIIIYGFKSQNISLISSREAETNFDITYNQECEFNTERAIEDWNKGNGKIFITSGIVSYVFPSDKTFETKYGVQFYDFGCIGPAPICNDNYNSKIFELMDLKFGKGWRDEIREDLKP